MCVCVCVEVDLGREMSEDPTCLGLMRKQSPLSAFCVHSIIWASWVWEELEKSMPGGCQWRTEKPKVKTSVEVSEAGVRGRHLHQRGAPAGLCAHCISTRGERHIDQSRPTSSPPRVGSSPPKPHAYPHSLTVTQSHTARAASWPQMGGWQCQWPPTTPPGTYPVLPSTSIRSESERVAPCKSCYHLDHSRSSSNPPHSTSTGEKLPLTQPLKMWPQFLLINLSLFSFEQK